MSHIVSLRQAIAENVRDGDMLALEGFTHLIPFAAGHEVIRQRRRNLSLVRMTPDLIYDQMIGMGCATRLTFSWGGNPGAGSLYRFRDAIENDWPHSLQIDERSHADVASAYVAGASNLPFSVLRGYTGSDLPKYNQRIRFINCPFTGERLAATPAISLSDRGLSSPLNVAYLWVIEFLLIGYVQSGVDELMQARLKLGGYVT